MTLCELLEEESKDIILALIPNLKTMILKYCNEYTLSLIQDLAPVGDNTPTKSFGLQHSNTTFGSKVNDFNSNQRKYEINNSTKVPGAGFKKQMTSMNVGHVVIEPVDDLSAQENYLISPEFKAELVYQELLPKLLIFDEHIYGMIGLWRQHTEFIDKFADTFKLFHMPELQDNYVQTLFKYLHNGNIQLRAKVCKAIVQILAYQYDPERRASLSKQVIEELGEARAFQIRRTFITFCRCCAGVLTKDYFLDNFYDALIAMASDRVAQVRMEFAKALIDVKPFIETEQEKDFQLMDIIDTLKNDPD